MAVKTLAASFGITPSTMRKAVLAMGIQTTKARFNGSKQHMLAITEEDAKRVRQASHSSGRRGVEDCRLLYTKAIHDR